MGTGGAGERPALSVDESEPGSGGTCDDQVARELKMVDMEMSHKIACAELEADIQRNQSAMKLNESVLKLRAEALTARGKIIDQAKSTSGSVASRSDRVQRWLEGNVDPARPSAQSTLHRPKQGFEDRRGQNRASADEMLSPPRESMAGLVPPILPRVTLRAPVSDSTPKATATGTGPGRAETTVTGNRTVLDATAMVNSCSLPALEEMVTDGADLSQRRRERAKDNYKLPKLPIFDGSSGWLDFIIALVDTTRDLAISQRENVYRLQEALQGDAKKLVGPFLTVANLPTAVKYLRMQFGDPETVLQQLEQDCARTASVDDDMSNLIPFVAKIDQLRLAIRSYGHLPRLDNRSLVSALFDKLPSHMRVAWATTSQGIQNPTLDQLADWLGPIAEAAPRGTNRAAKRVLLNFVPEEKKLGHNALQPAAPPVDAGFPCPAGCKVKHHLSTCPVFLRMGDRERLTLTRKTKVCWACLGWHQYECTHAVVCHCGVSHHPLMHEALTNDVRKWQQQNRVNYHA